MLTPLMAQSAQSAQSHYSVLMKLIGGDFFQSLRCAINFNRFYCIHQGVKFLYLSAVTPYTQDVNNAVDFLSDLWRS